MDTLVQNDQGIDGYLVQVRKVNLDNLVGILGIQKDSQGYRFEFFNRSISFDGNYFTDLSGDKLQPAIISVFCQYFLNVPIESIPRSDKFVTFREFPDAGPLFSRFTENTNKTIEQTFSNRLETLQKKCESLFGIPRSKSSYDFSVCFKALPKVPVIFQFNDADDMLPANASFLFHEDANKYLDLKSLARICTYLTGILIQ